MPTTLPVSVNIQQANIGNFVNAMKGHLARYGEHGNTATLARTVALALDQLLAALAATATGTVDASALGTLDNGVTFKGSPVTYS